MALRTTNGERGATLVALLLLLALLGIAASVTAQSWAIRIRTEKEAELLFRGLAYRAALESYARMTPTGAATHPQRLQDLVADDRFPVRVRHLRRLYADPMTGGPFIALRDSQGRIRGISSPDLRAPRKRTGFPEGLEHFEVATTYSGWTFVAD